MNNRTLLSIIWLANNKSPQSNVQKPFVFIFIINHHGDVEHEMIVMPLEFSSQLHEDHDISCFEYGVIWMVDQFLSSCQHQQICINFHTITFTNSHVSGDEITVTYYLKRKKEKNKFTLSPLCYLYTFL